MKFDDEPKKKQDAFEDWDRGFSDTDRGFSDADKGFQRDAKERSEEYLDPDKGYTDPERKRTLHNRAVRRLLKALKGIASNQRAQSRNWFDE